MTGQKDKTEELFIKTLNGDKKAFSELLLLVKDKLIRVSYKILKDYQLAEDTVYGIFLSIAKNEIKLKHSKNLAGYLNCIACNRSLNLLKKRKRETRLNENAEENGFIQEPQILEKIKIDLILSRMNKKQREALIYHYHGYTLAETADFMNTTISKIRTLLSNAKECFKTEYLKNE